MVMAWYVDDDVPLFLFPGYLFELCPFPFSASRSKRVTFAIMPVHTEDPGIHDVPQTLGIIQVAFSSLTWTGWKRDSKDMYCVVVSKMERSQTRNKGISTCLQGWPREYKSWGRWQGGYRSNAGAAWLFLAMLGLLLLGPFSILQMRVDYSLYRLAYTHIYMYVRMYKMLVYRATGSAIRKMMRYIYLYTHTHTYICTYIHTTTCLGMLHGSKWGRLWVWVGKQVGKQVGKVGQYVFNTAPA